MANDHEKQNEKSGQEKTESFRELHGQEADVKRTVKEDKGSMAKEGKGPNFDNNHIVAGDSEENDGFVSSCGGKTECEPWGGGTKGHSKAEKK